MGGMRLGSGVTFSVFAVCASLSLSCANCERTACEFLDHLANQKGTGMAGIVATPSDLVENGCQECPYGEATLELWYVDEPVTTEADASAVTEREPGFREAVVRDYRFELAPGQYLLCVRPRCIGLEIVANETLTVNIRRPYGWTAFFVGRPRAKDLEPDYGFEVGF